MSGARPHITLKYAQTLDGRIATASGHSRWVSGEASRVLAHRLRAEHDAVLVGVGTVLADDPRLDVREVPGRDPARVVLDRRLRTPPGAALFHHGSGEVIVVTRPDAGELRAAMLRDRGARIVYVNGSPTGELPEVMQRLHEIGIRTLLVEGGATVVTAMLRARLADSLVVIVAPRLIGAGIDAVGDLGTRRMDEAITLADLTVERSGDDMVFRGRLRWPGD